LDQIILVGERHVNPNTPVLVGVSQILQRIDDPLAGKEPVAMMLDAIHEAAADTGNALIIKEVDSIRVIRGIWRYKQPAQYLVDSLGLSNVETMGTPFGGNMVQSCVNRTALDILSGDRSVVIITGAENGNSQAKARKAGVEIPYLDLPGKYDAMLEEEVPMSSEGEIAVGIRAPIQIYPIIENAIRHQRGESIADHAKRISELWAGFSQVAKDNPTAWLREPVDAETIRTSGPKNRMVSFPYPKLMNSNNAVDMSSALIMCSVEKAKSLGIAEEKWVYPLAGTDAHDHYFISNRENLHSSPAIRIAGKKALELAGMSVSDIDLLDVYSCFPSAVQVAINELGLDASKPLTVTGGLTFGGGPLNNYVMHSIAKMVELLRAGKTGAGKSQRGMITANGGYLTKHAFGIYSDQPLQEFAYQNVQAEVDATPKVEVVEQYEGEVTIESYTVMYGPNGPAVGHAACRLQDGRRTWANTQDPEVVQAMTESEFCGRSASVKDNVLQVSIG
jgi:acetyl-CoA C-acetyltransferase